MEDYVHEFYSIEWFRAAYKRTIEPLPDVDLPIGVHAPLAKKTTGRNRKLRIKGCLEGGNSKGKKEAKEATNEAGKQVEIEAQKGKKKMIRGKRRCQRCGELGHGQISYKCPLNGTKKRPRKPRKNTTKYSENAKKSNKESKEGSSYYECFK